MFTQCPDCHKTYPVTKKQSRGKKAQIFCTDCKKKFNVSAFLPEQPTALVTEAKAEYIPKAESSRKPAQKKKLRLSPYSINISGFVKKAIPDTVSANPSGASPTPERLPWEIAKPSTHVPWATGFIVGLILLIGQLIYFEHDNWVQNPDYRPHLEKLCRWLGCQLPDYENLADFAVLQGSFTPDAENNMVFKAAINNQAAFQQRLPKIKLTLLDYSEQTFAQRVFLPKEYLQASKKPSFSIAPDETIEANLTIVQPKTPIGGYSFDLIH